MTGCTGGRREERRRQTHARIFGAALALFRERGFDAVAVGEIAAAADVSVPTFYAYFESKDHLILSLPAPEDIRQLVGSFPVGTPTVEMLRGVMLSFLTGSAPGLEPAEQVLERWQIIAASPALRLRAAAFERATAEIVLAALPPEERDDPGTQVSVFALMSAYTQILLRWAESKGERPVEEVVEEVLGALRDLKP